MSAPGTGTTTPRGARPAGRVLVVSDDRRTATILPALTRPSVRVSDIYAALGELSSAEDPFELVLVDHAIVDGTAARAAEALRRVDPSVRVVLLTGAPRSAAVGADAYDACVGVPDDLDRLEAIVRDADAADAAVPPAAAPEADREAPRTDVEPSPAPPGPAPDAPSETPTAFFPPPPIPSPPPPPPAPARRPTEPAVAPGAELGDVDLVERLLHPGASVLETALRLIVQQTGWDDVRLSTDVAPEPSGTPPAQAEVRYEDERFGWLRTNLAPADSIAPWARWLARWLALERSYAGFRLMAYQDDLTGAWNRRFFHVFLTETLELARQRRLPVTVMVFDIDNFKLYNDRFGHQAGDTVLTETVRLLTSVIRKGDRVCRMGGDEFAVIFADLEGPREAGSTHPSGPEHIAQRFQDQICRMRFPKLGAEAPGNLSISAGMATFPWDGLTPQELADCADRRALQSKQRGKNAITLGPGAERSR